MSYPYVGFHESVEPIPTPESSFSQPLSSKDVALIHYHDFVFASLSYSLSIPRHGFLSACGRNGNNAFDKFKEVSSASLELWSFSVVNVQPRLIYIIFCLGGSVLFACNYKEVSQKQKIQSLQPIVDAAENRPNWFAKVIPSICPSFISISLSDV